MITVVSFTTDLYSGSDFQNFYDLYKKITKGEFDRESITKVLRYIDYKVQSTKDRTMKEKYAAWGYKIAEYLRQRYPNRVEGYYFSALFLGYLGVYKGAQFILNYLPKIEKWALKAAKIDPDYLHGGTNVLVCALYYEAPGFPVSIGNIYKSQKYCEIALKTHPENCTTYLYLAAIYSILGEDKKKIIDLLDKGQNQCKPSDDTQVGMEWYKNDINTMKWMKKRLSEGKSIREFIKQR